MFVVKTHILLMFTLGFLMVPDAIHLHLFYSVIMPFFFYLLNLPYFLLNLFAILNKKSLTVS